MKKVITLCLGLFASLALQAQSDFPLQFVDKDGKVIPDGTALDLTKYEIDEIFEEVKMPTEVWVKNVSDETVRGGGSYTIQSISNGWFQTCFPSNCIRQSAAGAYSTGNATFAPGQLAGLQTEWLPDGEGTCVVVYQLQTFRKVGKNYIPDGDGPAITLYYSYGTTGIGDAKGGKKAVSVAYYDLTGKSAEHPRHGVYLKRTTYADGTADVQKSLFR